MLSWTRSSRTPQAARHRFPVTMGPAIADPEVVRLIVQPADALTSVRRALREVVAAARGPEQPGESDDWTPHVSVAYSNSNGPMGPYLRALDPIIGMGVDA
jgi:2'-5' RNA ligase superfamily